MTITRPTTASAADSWVRSSSRDGVTLVGLRTLRVLTIALPIVFVGALEVVRQLSADASPRDRSVDIALLGLVVVGIVAFSLMVLRIVGRTQDQLARRNRELSAANAVSSAVRGSLDLDELLDDALDSLLDASGAVDATIIRLAGDSRWRSTTQTYRRRASDVDAAMLRAGTVREIPLTTGATTVGMLRLRYPVGLQPHEQLATSTLETIAQQLAGAMHSAGLLADLRRGMLEGHGFYDVLLLISNQAPLPDILATVVQHARTLLASDDAVITLNAATARSLQSDGQLVGVVPLGDGGACVSHDDDHVRDIHGSAQVCPVRAHPDIRESLTIAIRGSDGAFGDIWLGRRDAHAYDEGDRRFLGALAELSSVAIANARFLERERQSATIAERERIAREMHDGMAQVLGVTHLRLRALESAADVRSLPDVHTEVTDLADLCLEAYSDVRESILGLREASKVDRALVDSLRTYVEKYSRQSGIPTTLDVDPRRDVDLPTRYQVQVLRVVQEALTNVRKHSGAAHAEVRVRDDDDATTITIADDGHGFDVEHTPFTRDGFGLHSMRERMALLGGTLTIDSRPGRGTRVVATVANPTRLDIPRAPEVAHVRD
jgi:signal transduction histidine kinase